jgi:hypothetical protein
MKFSFYLSAGLIIWLTLFFQIKIGRLIIALLILVACLLVIYSPFIFWKYYYFGGNLIELLTSPLPGNWLGTREFVMYLRNYRDSNIPFPISLIIPNGMGTLTTVFGFGLPLLVMILIYKGLWRNPFVILGIMNAIFGVLLGQANSRFFLESFYWIIIGVLVSGVLLPVQNFWLIISKGLIVLQSIFIFVAMSFGILTISVGSLSEDKRIKVMETSASYYKFMAWVNYILPFNALVLSELRSVALIPRLAFSTDFRNFVHPADFSSLYLKIIDQFKSPLYLLTDQEMPNSIPNACLGPIYAGPFVANKATRNPWNQGSSYDIMIYEVNVDCLTAIVNK